MKGKQIRVDWDDLEAAFNNRNEEITYYLDMITGHVHIDGEGEEEAFDDDGEPQYQSGDAGTRAVVTPPTTDILIDWMREFLRQGQAQGETAERLTTALDKKDVPGVRSVLNEDAEVRDLWYAFRADRTQGLIRDWLVKHEIQPAEPAPWE